MKPVIFLDMDGVVVTDESIRNAGAQSADTRCVAHLNAIVEQSDADIVISSSWRMKYSLDEIKSVLCSAGFQWPDRVIGATDHLHYRYENGRAAGRAERSDEIRQWLNVNHRERFVILDDDFDAEITGHFVRTPATNGLSPDHVEQAVGILRTRRKPLLR